MLSSTRIHLLATALSALCNTVRGVAIPPDSFAPKCYGESETRLIGDGNPYQKYQYVQLTVSSIAGQPSLL